MLKDMQYRKNRTQISQIVKHIDYGFLCLDVKEQNKISNFFCLLKVLDQVFTREDI